jgi:hypothetical protein
LVAKSFLKAAFKRLGKGIVPLFPVPCMDASDVVKLKMIHFVQDQEAVSGDMENEG